MFSRLFSLFFSLRPALLAACLCAVLLAAGRAGAAELPTLHLRRAAAPPPMSMSPPLLSDPSQAGGWYPSSPTWFGNGGLTGDRNHVEVLATYDSSALYLAFVVVDRSPNFTGMSGPASQLFDRNAIWIQTPQGRRFCFIPQLNGFYPAGGVANSLEITNFTGYGSLTNVLPLWSTTGWTAGQTWQEMVTIPWAAMSAGAPAPGSRWRVNFVNYNQYGQGPALSSSTINVEQWAPGGETQPSQWGTLAFDEAAFTPPAVSPEATLTLRPATGFGGEVTLRPGEGAAGSNPITDTAITQSNWNDADPIDYEMKEFLQFDLSMIPRDRVILGATLENYFAAPFEVNPTDLYVHVERLAGAYDPSAVTMLTSPLPVENGDRELVPGTGAGNWVSFDVSSTVAAAFAGGASQVSLALAGSSGDFSNGKAWAWSWGRADWYDQVRPRLHITFGKPGVAYSAPIQVGSLNSTSVAGTGNKNKLTNGTFRYGATEGVSNTTYWQDPGSAYVNGRNVPQMTLVGDVNPTTGDPAMRLTGSWVTAQQTATGIAGGQTYTLSTWVKASTPGQKLEINVTYRDAGGNTLASGSQPIACDSAWDQVVLTTTVPAGATQAVVGLKNWGLNGGADYDLYSDVQLEAGSSPTAYAETMGLYYPAHPRADGAVPTNAATFVSQSVPAAMVAGQSYPVTVTVQNTGSTTWAGAGAYRLGSQSPQDSGTWGMGRVPLPGPVAPGQSATFTFSVTAPSAPGTYPFQWRMVQDGVQWFGDYTPAQGVGVTGAAQSVGNAAAFVSQSVPAAMVAGQSYPVTVTVQNTGSTTWAGAGAYRLGSQSPQDSGTWGMGRVPLPGPVAPGQSATFTFSVTAPSAPGTYPFQWRMVQDGVQWFGDYTPAQGVGVTGAAQSVGNAAAFVSQSVPAAMVAGQSYPVTVTVQNTGSTTWAGAGAYRLGSQSPQDSGTWGMGRVPLPGPVAPGQSATFTFSVTAPSAPGTYPFQWRMVQDGVQWFGDYTPAQSVGVYTPARSVGAHAPAQGAGAHASARSVGVHAPAQSVGAHAPAQGAGAHASARSVGVHAPAQGVGAHAPAQSVGAR